MEEERRYTFDREFHEIVTNKEVLRRTTEKFLNNLIDDITLGIIFDTHRKFKTKAFNLDRDESPSSVDTVTSSVEIFAQAKKPLECMCPKCGRDVLATGFALHLEICMGLGRSRSRNVSRRIINNNSKERDSQTYTGLATDDEDDVDWNSGDKRRKKKYRNGSRKGKGTPKKTSEPDLVESINVDIEGEDESDLTNLRDLLQDKSNGSSPADSLSNSNSSSNSSKKKEKSKSKKSSKRDRSNNAAD